MYIYIFIYKILITVDPFNVADRVPAKEEIKWAAKRICPNYDGAPSEIRAEYLKNG